jgi:hypothetical protein
MYKKDYNNNNTDFATYFGLCLSATCVSKGHRLMIPPHTHSVPLFPLPFFLSRTTVLSPLVATRIAPGLEDFLDDLLEDGLSHRLEHEF